MKKFFALILAVLLSGCTTTQVGSIYRPYFGSDNRPRDILVTIDGTGNSQISRTNAARLFEIVDARATSPSGNELATYYGEGVGSEGELLGLAAGSGMSEDIRNAYTFLTRTYRPKDRLVLSGFSRGAYAVRALNGMIAVAGIPDLSDRSPKDRKRIVKKLFKAYRNTPRGNMDIPARFELRLSRVMEVYREEGITPPQVNHETPVLAMAIWDTVEAMGWPDYSIKPDERDRHYYLTNCNVGTTFHAMALDDNRAYSFTPIFAKGAKNFAMCPERQRSGAVDEVWFAGAHADVGGSYAPDDHVEGHLPGVSMNWMLKRMASIGFVPEGTSVFADPMGPIHDAKANNPAYKILDRHFRYPMEYGEVMEMKAKQQFHRTAIERLEKALEIDRHFAQCRDGKLGRTMLCGHQLRVFGPVAELRDRGCLVETATGYRLKKDQPCIEVVD